MCWIEIWNKLVRLRLNVAKTSWVQIFDDNDLIYLDISLQETTSSFRYESLPDCSPNYV